MADWLVLMASCKKNKMEKTMGISRKNTYSVCLSVSAVASVCSGSFTSIFRTQSSWERVQFVEMLRSMKRCICAGTRNGMAALNENVNRRVQIHWGKKICLESRGIYDDYRHSFLIIIDKLHVANDLNGG